jgi:hypothetical protein
MYDYHYKVCRKAYKQALDRIKCPILLPSQVLRACCFVISENGLTN